jgi:type I restriction enzyme S subunit
MKSGWKCNTIEELCEFSSGLWKGDVPPFLNVGVIRNTNFSKDGKLDFSDVAYLDVEAKKFEKRRLVYGDIILEKSGGGPKQPVGRVALFDKEEGDFSFSNFTSSIRVRCPDELNYRFLHKFLYWIYTTGVTEGMQSHSTGIRNLDNNAYKAIQVRYPAPPEQHRIVSILDEAFEGIATATANAEKNLSNARELFDSTLQSIFSNNSEEWVKQTFSEVCEITSALVDPKETKYLDMLHVGGANIESKTGRTVGLKTARDEGLISGKFVFDESMVLYSKIRPYLMKVARPEFQGLCSADIYPLSSKIGKLDRNFLFYLLLTPLFTEYANAGSARAGMPKVNREHLFAYTFLLPSIKTQIQCAAKLDEVSAEVSELEYIYQQKLSALAELKKSILHQAFSGQLN